MVECNTCNETIAEDARICPKCGANRYKKITGLSILLNIVQSFFITIFVLSVTWFINKQIVNNLTDSMIFLLMGIIFILLIFKDYNTKKEN